MLGKRNNVISALGLWARPLGHFETLAGVGKFWVWVLGALGQALRGSAGLIVPRDKKDEAIKGRNLTKSDYARGHWRSTTSGNKDREGARGDCGLRDCDSRKER